MNRSVAVAHDDYTVYCTCRCVQHCQQATDYPLTVVAMTIQTIWSYDNMINTNTANDLSPPDLLNVTAHTFWHSPDTPTSRFKGLLFAWTLWIYLPNLKFVALRVPGIIGGTLKFRKSLDKPTLPFLPLPNLNFVALPVPEIIAGTEKNWAVPGYANAPFSPKFLKGFCWDKPCEYTCQIWSS